MRRKRHSLQRQSESHPQHSTVHRMTNGQHFIITSFAAQRTDWLAKRERTNHLILSLDIHFIQWSGGGYRSSSSPSARWKWPVRNEKERNDSEQRNVKWMSCRFNFTSLNFRLRCEIIKEFAVDEERPASRQCQCQAEHVDRVCILMCHRCCLLLCLNACNCTPQVGLLIASTGEQLVRHSVQSEAQQRPNSKSDVSGWDLNEWHLPMYRCRGGLPYKTGGLWWSGS